MEFALTFIRGTFTGEGKENRFLGRIDRPAHPGGLALLRDRAARGEYPRADAVFSSPLTRSMDSARAIYGHAGIAVLEQLTAFDYGDFSGKSYSEIATDKQFAHWADDAQLSAFPGGEAPYAFTNRCSETLREMIAHAQERGLQNVSVVTHQSVIGAILQRHSIPSCLYTNHHLDYGDALTTVCNAESEALKVRETF